VIPRNDVSAKNQRDSNFKGWGASAPPSRKSPGMVGGLGGGSGGGGHLHEVLALGLGLGEGDLLGLADLLDLLGGHA